MFLIVSMSLRTYGERHTMFVGLNMFVLYPIWLAPAIDYGIVVHKLVSGFTPEYTAPQLDPWDPNTKFVQISPSALKTCAIIGLTLSIFYL